MPWSEDPVAAFHQLHERRYGYADTSRLVEVVNVRVRAAIPTRHEIPEPSPIGETSAAAPFDTRQVFFDETGVPTGLYRRDELGPGNFVSGPAVVVEYSSTTLVPPDWTASVDGYANLLIARETNP